MDKRGRLRRGIACRHYQQSRARRGRAPARTHRAMAVDACARRRGRRVELRPVRAACALPKARTRSHAPRLCSCGCCVLRCVRYSAQHAVRHRGLCGCVRVALPPAKEGARRASRGGRRHENTTDARRFVVSPRSVHSCSLPCGVRNLSDASNAVRRGASTLARHGGTTRSGRSGALHRRIWRRTLQCGGLLSRWGSRAPNHSADPAAG